ncbi:MAG: UDP-4-amino-4,6-dideoxy-N-acetyl-beta-L-altrosamine transaminase [Synergistaceae bacterium]|nr:UDP-4-amino-4,6-dideoxy-N-acetyl-beta-L-altrosamine transaminase [Synergistaceae bacterium]
MKSLSYGRQWIDENDIAEVVNVLKGDWLSQGPVVKLFEEELAEYIGTREAVVFSSGTAALHGSVIAAGLKEGDEMLTTSMTFVATANAALYAGAEPIFADISKDTLCMAPIKAETKLSRKVKAIVPVSFAGYPINIEPFRAMAKECGAVLIEDACHSLGGVRTDNGGRARKIGRDADMTVFSFHPVKHITTGEGGAVVTDDAEYARRLRMFRNHGITRSAGEFEEEADGPWHSEMQMLGFNYRLSDIQCALGRSQLKRLGMFIGRRRELAEMYRSMLADEEGVCLPPSQEGHAWHLFPIRVGADIRAALFSHLSENGIRPQVHYLPVSLHPYYKRRFGYKKGDFPEAERFYGRTLSLPLYPSMEDADVERVVSCVKSFFKKSKAITFRRAPPLYGNPENVSERDSRRASLYMDGRIAQNRECRYRIGHSTD